MQVGGIHAAYPVTTAASAPSKIDKSSELYKVSQQFEAILIKQMLDSMRSTINKDDQLLDTKANGQEYYQDMLYTQYADLMSQTAGFGLADSIYRELSSK
jgi:peptidoglycan hydrolase FlgJ